MVQIAITQQAQPTLVDQPVTIAMQAVVGMVLTVLLDLAVVVIQDHVIRNMDGSSVMEVIAVVTTSPQARTGMLAKHQHLVRHQVATIQQTMRRPLHS